MDPRYEHARQKALKGAAAVQQVDFAETLDECMRAALAGDDLVITTGRAVEMFNRLSHFFECMHKYFERNREMMREKPHD